MRGTARHHHGGAAALLAAALSAAPVAVAQEPPPAPPPNARFGTGSVSFGTGSVSFGTGTVAFGSGAVAFPSARVAEPTVAGSGPRAEVRFGLSGDVLFDFDRAELRPEAEGVLRDLAGQVRARFPRGPVSVRVEGHTDSRGEDAYNEALSLRRAEAVRRWLGGPGGLPPASIRAEGLGERRPVAPNARPDGSDDPEGRQRNRRVEIVASQGGGR